MRKELIERLRDYAYEGDPLHLMEQAADMLEADAPAVPQEPVAILNHAHGVHAIRSVNIAGLPDGEYKLFAAPQQQPRLTDEEIEDFADASTGYSRMVDIKYFARAIEKKVRGEA